MRRTSLTVRARTRKISRDSSLAIRSSSRRRYLVSVSSEPVELVRGRPECLGQDLPGGDFKESCPRRVTIARPLDPDEVTEVEVVEQRVLISEHVGLGVEPDPSDASRRSMKAALLCGRDGC